MTKQGQPFQDFDLTNFWNDANLEHSDYYGEPLTDELLAEIEAELGFKLPDSYVYLMRQHNGGRPMNTCFPTDTPTSWSEDHIEIFGIFSIGRAAICSLGGVHGSQFWIDEWEYPPIGVAFCDTQTAGHEMVFLDYRECGPQGEPQVVHIDQEYDYAITVLAPDFESFIRGLVHSDYYE